MATGNITRLEGVWPETHERAVRDSAGVNLETKLGNINSNISQLGQKVGETNELYLQGTGINSSTGAYTNNASYCATQKIAVSENDVITAENTIYRVAKYARYDLKAFKGLDNPGGTTYTVPAGITEIALMFLDAYIGCGIYINGKSANGIFLKNEIDGENDLSKENPIYYFGKNINSGNGQYTDNANCFTTLDIPVSQGDVLTGRKMYRVAEYANGSFVRLAVNESNTYTTPSGVDTIRIVFIQGYPAPLYLNGIRVGATILQNLKGASAGALNAHINDHNNPHQVTTQQLGITDATTTQAGFMSPLDKAKLDSLQPGDITISGSGITKNTSAFGFLPTASGDENNVALQNAVNGGGTILVDLPGTYDLSGNIVIPSNTTIIFGANTFVRKVANGSNVVSKHIFINEGAQTRTYNENISIIGLHLYPNGKSGNGGIVIYGLRGHIALFYVKNVLLKDITIIDSTQLNDFNIHICTFDSVTIDNVQINSYKDGLHFGNGKNLTIRDCVLATKDDPIALNAYDYVSGNPELGWLENIHIYNTTLEERADSNGRAIELIGGGWSDWAAGNEYQSQGDTVVYDGKIFRTTGAANGTTYVAANAPAATTLGQSVTGADGITWTLMQIGEVYDCGVKGLYVDGFVVRHGGNTLFNVSYEISASYCRSYYPESENYGILEDLYFNGVYMTKKMDRVLNVTAPVRNIKISNSVLNATYLGYYQNYKGGTNPSSEASLLTLDGNSFPLSLASMRLDTYDRDIKLKTYGSMPINTNFSLGKMARVEVVTTDI